MTAAKATIRFTFNDHNSTVRRGKICSLIVECGIANQFDQMQVEITSAGIKNPIGAISLATKPENVGNHLYQINIPTEALVPGFYEISLIRLHSPISESALTQIDFVKEVDFERELFLINTVFDRELSRNDVFAACSALEGKLATQFTSGIRLSHHDSAQPFTCFIFVKGILIGLRTGFDRFEVVPYDRGLDSRDKLDLINEFFQTNNCLFPAP